MEKEPEFKIWLETFTKEIGKVKSNTPYMPIAAFNAALTAADSAVKTHRVVNRSQDTK